MNHDKVLEGLVKEQTDAFNRNASEGERVSIYQQILVYQKIRKSGER
jgi:hypothetical protein